MALFNGNQIITKLEICGATPPCCSSCGGLWDPLDPLHTTNVNTNNYHYSHPPPTTYSVPKINMGKSFEMSAKILRGLRRFCKNLAAEAGATAVAALTLLF